MLMKNETFPMRKIIINSNNVFALWYAYGQQQNSNVETVSSGNRYYKLCLLCGIKNLEDCCCIIFFSSILHFITTVTLVNFYLQALNRAYIPCSIHIT